MELSVFEECVATFLRQLSTTAPPSSPTLQNVNKFLVGPFAHRDKLGRLVQYGARGMRGVFTVLSNRFDSAAVVHKALRYLHQKCHLLFLMTARSRRTYRWLASTTVLLALRRILLEGKKCPFGDTTVDRNVFVGKSVLLLLWHFFDHARWLQTINFLPGSQIFTRRVSFGCFALSNFLVFAHTLPRAFPEIFANANRSSDGGDKADEKLRMLHYRQRAKVYEKTKARRACLKALVSFITFSHVSELWCTHDWICGFTGVFTSCMDLQDLWRKSVGAQQQQQGVGSSSVSGAGKRK